MRELPRGVDPDVTEDRFPLITLDDMALRSALLAWRATMGTPWFGTPGTAGAQALEGRIKACRTWHAAWKTDGPPRAAEAALRPSQWDQRADSTAPHLHGYDVTRMYAVASGTTEVCPHALRQTGPQQFDRSLAGWWLVDLSMWCWPEIPDPAGYANRHHRPGDPRWLTTPTVRLIQQLHEEGAHGGFTVLDSWTGKGRPIFRDWAAGLERLYRDGGPEMRATVKAAGRETIGLLNSPTYTTYRPDWHYAVIAQARSNLWRKLWRQYGIDGRTPSAVDTDCVWYGSRLADPIAACPSIFVLGDAPGQVKHKGTVVRG